MMNINYQTTGLENDSDALLAELIDIYGEGPIAAARLICGSDDIEVLENMMDGFYLGCSDNSFEELFDEYFWDPSNHLGGCVPDELKFFLDVKGYRNYLLTMGQIVTQEVNGKTHAFFSGWNK